MSDLFRILVLEDDENRVKQFKNNFALMEEPVNAVFVDNAPECILHIKEEKFQIIFLDHDLGHQIFVDQTEENTGSGVARWMSKNFDHPNMETPIIIHSLNYGAAQYMLDLIPNENRNHFPFAWDRSMFSLLSLNGKPLIPEKKTNEE